MPLVSEIFVGVAILSLFLSGWMLFCNHLTWKQRDTLLSKIQFESDSTLARFYLNHFDTVPYNTHLWYLMTFRNPMSLYDL